MHVEYSTCVEWFHLGEATAASSYSIVMLDHAVKLPAHSSLVDLEDVPDAKSSWQPDSYATVEVEW